MTNMVILFPYDKSNFFYVYIQRLKFQKVDYFYSRRGSSQIIRLYIFFPRVDPKLKLAPVHISYRERSRRKFTLRCKWVHRQQIRRIVRVQLFLSLASQLALYSRHSRVSIKYLLQVINFQAQYMASVRMRGTHANAMHVIQVVITHGAAFLRCTERSENTQYALHPNHCM